MAALLACSSDASLSARTESSGHAGACTSGSLGSLADGLRGVALLAQGFRVVEPCVDDDLPAGGELVEQSRAAGQADALHTAPAPVLRAMHYFGNSAGS